MPKVLSKEESDRRLKRLKGWRTDGSFLTKTFEFDEFMDGIGFIERVAKVAEGLNHHPDIHVRYTSVTFKLQTHSEGGVTEWDFELAKAIDGIGLMGTGKVAS